MTPDLGPRIMPRGGEGGWPKFDPVFKKLQQKQNTTFDV
jgi:hypothetical protein